MRQLKDSLEKLKNPVDVEILNKTGKKNQTLPLKKIDLTHSKLNEVESVLFEKRLEKIIESEKSISIKNHLKCFEDYGQYLEEKKQEENWKDQKMQEIMRTHKRLLKINHLKRYLQFKNTWERGSKNQWMKNLQIRKENVEIQKNIEIKKRKKLKTIQRLVKDNIKVDCFNEITKFENNLGLINKDKESGNSEKNSKQINLSRCKC